MLKRKTTESAPARDYVTIANGENLGPLDDLATVRIRKAVLNLKIVDVKVCSADLDCYSSRRFTRSYDAVVVTVQDVTDESAYRTMDVCFGVFGHGMYGYDYTFRCSLKRTLEDGRIVYYGRRPEDAADDVDAFCFAFTPAEYEEGGRIALNLLSETIVKLFTGYVDTCCSEEDHNSEPDFSGIAYDILRRVEYSQSQSP